MCFSYIPHERPHWSNSIPQRGQININLLLQLLLVIWNYISTFLHCQVQIRTNQAGHRRTDEWVKRGERGGEGKTKRWRYTVGDSKRGGGRGEGWGSMCQENESNAHCLENYLQFNTKTNAAYNPDLKTKCSSKALLNFVEEVHLWTLMMCQLLKLTCVFIKDVFLICHLCILSPVKFDWLKYHKHFILRPQCFDGPVSQPQCVSCSFALASVSQPHCGYCDEDRQHTAHHWHVPADTGL